MKTLTIPNTTIELTLPGPFQTLAEMKACNAASGRYYFQRSAMRFFDSKPLRGVHAGRFFIDSIQFHGSNGYTAPREYKVVAVMDNGETHKVARVMSDGLNLSKMFPSAAEARRFLRELIRTAIDRDVPNYENQLWQARRLANEKGIEALRNPHAMIGQTCGCGSCFCCAAAQVLDELLAA